MNTVRRRLELLEGRRRPRGLAWPSHAELIGALRARPGLESLSATAQEAHARGHDCVAAYLAELLDCEAGELRRELQARCGGDGT